MLQHMYVFWGMMPSTACSVHGRTSRTGLEDEIQATAKAVVDGCKHTFCVKCLREWIEFKPEAPVCPLCKRAITGYTHGYGKLNARTKSNQQVQGAGTADEPFELLDDDDAAGPSAAAGPSTAHPNQSSAAQSSADVDEFCLEHTEVRPRPPPRLPSFMGGGNPLGANVLGVPLGSLFNDAELAILQEVFGFAMQAHMRTWGWCT